MNKKYIYDGAVSVNGIVTDRHYHASTMAPSEKKAIQNIIYRYKEEVNLPYTAKVKLESKIQFEKTYHFHGDVYLDGKIIYVGYDATIDAFDEEVALIRMINIYKDKQFLSDECDIMFKGEIAKKEK